MNHTELDECIDIFFEHCAKTQSKFTTAYDPHWSSECELGQPFTPPIPETLDETRHDGSEANGYEHHISDHETNMDRLGGTPRQQLIAWEPKRRAPSTNDFVGLERALKLEIHADIKTHYGRYWANHLQALAPEGEVSMLYLWNAEDSERLIENLVGHAVACKQNKTPFSVFFACTEADSEYYLTVNNSTGQIQLEEPGSKPLKVVSNSLAEFYQILVPAQATSTA